MGKLNHVCIGLALVAQALGQSSTNFAPRPVTADPVPQEVTPAPAKATAQPAPTAASANAGIQSRYVGPDELESHMTSMVSVFHAMSREKDPFGQFQDPDAKPVVRVATRGIARRAPAKATPLSEIVGFLPITTIMPGERSFLVGTRKVALGQEIPLVFRGKTLRVRVTEVSSTRIAFRDVETDEVGTRTMDILPVGMSIGNGRMEISAPGMVPYSPDAPIELGGGDMTMTQ